MKGRVRKEVQRTGSDQSHSNKEGRGRDGGERQCAGLMGAWQSRSEWQSKVKERTDGLEDSSCEGD